MDQEELQKLVKDISLKHFHIPFQHSARFNNRLRTTGGRYLLHSHDIEINPKYYKEQGMDELIGIIKHELCHYHLHLQGKGYKHKDRDFKELLVKVGAPRHCKPLKKQVNSFKYIYECMACGQQYKRKKRMDTKKFVCGRCNGKIKILKSLVD